MNHNQNFLNEMQHLWCSQPTPPPAAPQRREATPLHYAALLALMLLTSSAAFASQPRWDIQAINLTSLTHRTQVTQFLTQTLSQQ